MNKMRCFFFASICIILAVIIYDYIFNSVEIRIKELYIDESYLNNVNVYNVSKKYSDTIKTPDDAKTIYITLEIYNKSFFKTYKYLQLENENTDYPFVGESFDMGGEAGVKTLLPRETRIQHKITALVDGNVNDQELIELLSSKKVKMKGIILGKYRTVTKPIYLKSDTGTCRFVTFN